MEDNILQPTGSNGSNDQPDDQKNNTNPIDNPREFDIKEVGSEDPTVEAEKGGTIDLGKGLDVIGAVERLEKLRMRKFLTYTVLLLSVAWIIAGLVHYLVTGNSFLIIAASPMSGPILIIMGYYFGEQLLQRYSHRGP